MRAALTAFVLASVLAVSAPAAAQSLGLGRRLGRPLPSAPAVAAEARPVEGAADADAPRNFAGPQVQLHYEHFRLSDGHGAGDVHAGGLAVYVQWPVSELRTGLLASLGSRDYALGGDDLVARGALEIGFQLTGLLDPFVPHLSAVVTFGGAVEERFETTVAHALGGGGVELGATVRLYGSLHLSATVGYLRLEMDGAAHDAFLLRVAAGL